MSGRIYHDGDGRAGCGWLLVILACAVAGGIAVSSLGEHEVRYVQDPPGPAGSPGPPGERGDPGAAAPPPRPNRADDDGHGAPHRPLLPPCRHRSRLWSTWGIPTAMGCFCAAPARWRTRIAAYPDGTPLVVIGPDAVAQGRTWKHVRTPDGRVGYVPARYTVGAPRRPAGPARR